MSRQDKQYAYLLQDDSELVRDMENWTPSGLSPEEIEAENKRISAEFAAELKAYMGKS
nr:MAG TPA: hypothetical protein [Caudoviricetes sp.]